MSEVPPPGPYVPAPIADSSSVVPYVEDDGSADLLEEVLAIERETEERKRGSKGKEKEREKESKVEKVKEAPPPPPKIPKLVLNHGKRKKPTPADEPESEDEELLALAAPSKKSKSSASPPSSAPPAPGPSTEKPTPPPPIAPAPVKNGVSLKNNKERAVKTSTKTSSETLAGLSEPSRKGKEKVAPTPGTTAPARTRSPTQTPINEKKCKDVLKALCKLPDAAIFLLPVDPVRDGCPTCVIVVEKMT